MATTIQQNAAGLWVVGTYPGSNIWVWGIAEVA